MSTSKTENILAKMKDFWLKNEQKIMILVGFCLISAISFEFGVLQGQKWQQKPLIIEKPTETPDPGQTGQNQPPASSGSNQNQQPLSNLEKMPIAKSCAYVGSKNSNKFYLPTCSFAKRIKPENVVCFQNAQDAISQGRTESKCN